MSTSRDDLIRLADRGERVKAIRQDRREDQPQFALILRDRLRGLGVHVDFDKSKVSKTEKGKRDMTPEEVAIVAELDPQQRGVPWLVFGRDIAVQRPRRAIGESARTLASRRASGSA